MKRAAVHAMVVSLLEALATSIHIKLDPSTIPVPVRPIALLQSNYSYSTSGAESHQTQVTSCVAVAISYGYLLAQAHCVAQLDPQALEFAEFGLLPFDSSDGTRVGVERLSAPILASTYRPEFAAKNSNNVSNSSFIDKDEFTESDFVVIQVDSWPAKISPAVLVDNTVERLRTGFGSPNFGVLQVDPDSLKLTWLVGDVTMVESTLCGFEPNSAQAQDYACVLSPRQWTADQGASTDGNVGKQRPWSLFFHAHGSGSGLMYFFGFASGGARATSPQRFLWPASAVDFLGDPAAPYTSWKAQTRYRGGSLIGVTYVLTAAHCVEGDNLPSFVSVGSLQTRGTEEGEQIRVANVIVHPDYDSVSRANDLALAELEVTSMQIPIPMYTSPRSGTIFGYGAKSSDPIDGEPNSQCMQLLQQHPVHTSMSYAGGLISKDACVGDSGGPLVAQSVVVVPDSVALTGVISYGRGDCGSGAFPGVYANVTKAEQFIRQYVRDAKWTSELDINPFPIMDLGALPGPVIEPPTTTSGPPSLSLPPSFSTLPVDNSNSNTTSTSTNSTSPTKYYTPIADNKYEVPADLSPGVKNALIGFLIGDMDKIDSSHLSDLLNESKLVFTSTQSLEGVKK